MLAYRNRRTLDSNLAKLITLQTSLLFSATTGHWFDPDSLIPGRKFDNSEAIEQSAKAAERSLDRNAKDK